MASKTKQKREFYLGNESLPTPEATFDYENNPEWVYNLQKCKKNILYFAENFFYITNLDEGKIKIDLRLFQKRILRSLRDNRFVVLLASRQIGKALAINTPILTTNGWTTMGEIETGDSVYGADGTPCTVLYAHEVLNERKCYKVIFDNEEEIITDAEHLWYTESENDGELVGSVKTTEEIANTLYTSYNNKPNHRIPNRLSSRLSNDQPKHKSQWHYIIQVVEVASVPVRCITVNSKDNLYLAGKKLIPTHNTTLMTIYALWIACFSDDQRILIVANKEQTAINIFKRIRMAYEKLPNYLKPGTIEYGKTSMALGNGSSIGISTTSSDAGRGDSCNCVGGSTIVTLRDIKTKKKFDISMKDLQEVLEKNGELELTIVDD